MDSAADVYRFLQTPRRFAPVTDDVTLRGDGWGNKRDTRESDYSLPDSLPHVHIILIVFAPLYQHHHPGGPARKLILGFLEFGGTPDVLEWFAERQRRSGGLWCKVRKRAVRLRISEIPEQVARTAFRSSGIVAERPPNLPVLKG